MIKFQLMRILCLEAVICHQCAAFAKTKGNLLFMSFLNVVLLSKLDLGWLLELGYSIHFYGGYMEAL
jgi:hypothetical protein